MKAPAISRSNRQCLAHQQERGITMILVALAMVAIIAMAALSIDVVTLYLAREEAQRSADSGALAAARVISLSGVTGTTGPDNDIGAWRKICGPDDGTNGVATRVAKAIAGQNAVAGISPTVSVTYSSGTGAGFADCTAVPGDDLLGVNPLVRVQITRASLPTFFSRIWSRTTNTVSATATAEVFNPSNSGAFAPGGDVVPVQPRCVKPWVIPNLDPLNPNTACTNNCQPFVGSSDGHIMNPGISLNGGNANGVIGETFQLIPNCMHHITGSCSLRNTPIQANHAPNGNTIPAIPNLEYLPGATGATPYEQAIAGCDQTTVYYCGVPKSSPIGSGPNIVDLGTYPADDTTTGVQALIHEGNPNANGGQPTGQDTFNTYAAPSAYPFQILVGTNNPVGLTSGTPVTTSNSVVSVPIYDPGNPIAPTGTSPVTIVGFLQVFINAVDQYGNVDVLVLNVAGCGNGSTTPGTAVAGSSPVPIRLITPP